MLIRHCVVGSAVALLLSATGASAQIPPRLNIYHFDVSTGDATLILTPEGRGILIDAGNTGRGLNPVVEFLDRARDSGDLVSLDHTIVTHYDADHIGGMDDVLNNGWYPEVSALDRGDSLLPPLDRDYVEDTCEFDPDEIAALAMWGSAPASFCPNRASCAMVEYFRAAIAGGRRETIEAGDVLTFDNGITLTAIVVNAGDMDGNTVNLDFIKDR